MVATARAVDCQACWHADVVAGLWVTTALAAVCSANDNKQLNMKVMIDANNATQMNDSVVVCSVLEWTVWSCEHDACARQDCDQVDATAA